MHAAEAVGGRRRECGGWPRSARRAALCGPRAGGRDGRSSRTPSHAAPGRPAPRNVPGRPSRGWLRTAFWGGRLAQRAAASSADSWVGTPGTRPVSIKCWRRQPVGTPGRDIDLGLGSERGAAAAGCRPGGTARRCCARCGPSPPTTTSFCPRLQHHPAPAARPGLRRGRPRTAARRPGAASAGAVVTPRGGGRSGPNSTCRIDHRRWRCVASGAVSCTFPGGRSDSGVGSRRDDPGRQVTAQPSPTHPLFAGAPGPELPLGAAREHVSTPLDAIFVIRLT